MTIGPASDQRDDGSEGVSDGGRPIASTVVPPPGSFPAPPPPAADSGSPPVWPPSPGIASKGRGSRGIRIALIAALVLVLAVASVAIPGAILSLAHSGSSGRSSGSSTILPPTSPAAAYQQALKAASTVSSVHYVAVTTGGGADQRIVGNATQNGGTQVITFDATYGAENFTLVLTNGTVYFQGNGPALEDQLGVASTAAPGLQGKWISVSKGDGPYAVLAPGITVADQVQQLALQPSSAEAIKAAGGSAAIRILGSVPSQNGSPVGTGRLDVAAGSHLPISFVSFASGGGVSVTSTTTFSGWGARQSIARPSGAVAWSTLGASVPAGGFGSGGGQAPGAPSQSII